MPQPVPDPVQHFFVRFLSNPEEIGRRNLCINLLNLELDRARYNVLSVPPLFEPSGDYRSDIIEAEHALKLACRDQVVSDDPLDLPYHWLTLLGNRLAVERDLPVGGIKALAHVAAVRSGLLLAEIETWLDIMIFQQFTQTVLRDEWDYHGIQFRYPRSVWPPEAT